MGVAGPKAVDVVTVTRIFLASVMLTGAAYSDIQTRRVPNKYWFPFLAIAAGLLLADLVGAWQDTWQAVLVAVGSLALFYVLWWLGLLFGGADAKALMVLALLVPHDVTNGPWTLTPAIDSLFNGTLATLVLPVGIALMNMARGRWAGVATFLAMPMSITRARQRHVWPLERADDGQVRRRLWQRRGEDLDAVYDALGAAGVTVVWATPKIPFIVPLLIGWLSAVFWGNVLLHMVALIVS